MTLGDILNVFAGLALTFALVSLVVSSITEALASGLKWRSATLLQGLKDLLNDPDVTGLAQEILNHSGANPRGPSDPVTAQTAANAAPSYMSSTQFASALVDIVQNKGQGTAQAGVLAPVAPAGLVLTKQNVSSNLQNAFPQISDAQMRTLLTGMYARAEGDVVKFRQEIASWFDAAMDRVSGAYKRRSQYVSVGIGLLIAILLNLDAFHIALTLWSHLAIATQLSQLNSVDVKAGDALRTLNRSDFPYGWGGFDLSVIRKSFGVQPFTELRDGILTLLGWCATAIATLFGAPFWFDTLKRFVQLGGTGPKPSSSSPSS